jgi:hypothetical protein
MEHLVAGLEHFVRDYGVVAVLVILTLEALGAPVPYPSLRGLRATSGSPEVSSSRPR